MKVKSTKDYEVYFEDDELVDALVHWITNVRSRCDMIDIATVMHNAKVKVVRKKGKVLLKFSIDEEDQDF